MSKQTTSTTEHGAAHGSPFSYLTGFIFSLIFTAAAYLSVTQHFLSGGLLLAILSILALAQLTVQLIFFLHLGNESRPRWNLNVLLFAVLVVFIVVGGSLWIMHNLNYHMTTDQMNNYMNKQDGL